MAPKIKPFYTPDDEWWVEDTQILKRYGFDDSVHRQSLIDDFLKTDSDVLNLVNATDPFMAQAQSMRKLLQTINHIQATTPTHYTARALKVEILTGVQAGVGPEQRVGSKKARFKVYARRFGPTTDMLQPSVDPCKLTGKDAINKAIALHPVYYPVNDKAIQPSVGDIIQVSIFESKTWGTTTNEYYGILQSELLKPRKNAQNKTNNGRRDAPQKSETAPIDCKTINNLRRAAKKEPTNKFLKNNQALASNVINYNGHINNKNADKLEASVKLFLIKLNEIAPNETRAIKGGITGLEGGAKIRFTDFERTAAMQADRMYTNWVSMTKQGIAPSESGAGGPSAWWKDLTKANATLDKYRNQTLIKKIKEIFKNNYKQEAIKQAQVLLDKTPVSAHQVKKHGGTSIDIGLIRTTPGDRSKPFSGVANVGLFKILKKVAQATCSFILIEKDHFHINTNAKKFGWKKDVGVGGDNHWSEGIPQKGPPKK
jgi:hypothetical protein